MSTTIGSVTLDRDMNFKDEYLDRVLVNASVEETLGGGVVVQEYERLEKGRKVTLEATETIGYQLKSTVDDLIDLASEPNATYTLTITTDGRTFSKTVRFRNEVNGGPVQFEPFHPRGGYHADTIYYKGTIYLMVI